MALSPVWPHSLPLWLATSLNAGIMLWSRQDGTLFLALIMGATPLRDSLRLACTVALVNGSTP